ncbi:MAG: hypothetical protein GX422_14630 [Deltaproteobacteria bacterium]|jgi:hypothetical protein|nr:hypothetical protein [Deltaproteobacteria bacterium]
MKAIRIILILLIMCGFLVPFGTGAQAADSYICTVQQAGPSGAKGVVKILLYDTGKSQDFGKNNQKWFKAQTGREKEMLAVALAAMNAGYQVQAFVDLQKSLITTLYMIMP